MRQLTKFSSIEFNNACYNVIMRLPPDAQLIENGKYTTFFICGLQGAKQDIKNLFEVLKRTKLNSVLSIYTSRNRFIVEHKDAHLHLNIGNARSIRDRNVLSIEWQVFVIGSLQPNSTLV